MEYTTLYRGSIQMIGEISCVIKNRGSNMVIVTNVQCRARYRMAEDQESTYPSDDVEPNLQHGIHRYFLAQARTFVQAGVTQHYRKPIAMPASAQVLRVVGAFDYRINVGRITNALIWLFARPPQDIDWRRGIQNHTALRPFYVADR